MDVYRRGGDSLMGRYFLYRMHPFSVAETLTQEIPNEKRVIRQPKKISAANFNALWTHGGYPEPFLKRDMRFSRRWQSLRLEQLVREDIRDLTQIQQLDQLELLVKLLTERSAHQLIYGNLANDIRVSIDTTRRWIDILVSLHLGFLIRPWFKTVSRSLRKEPKWFLHDWASIKDQTKRKRLWPVTCSRPSMAGMIWAWASLNLATCETRRNAKLISSSLVMGSRGFWQK